MIVCQHCKKEMKPILNGVLVVFQKAHVYAGDRYACEGCGCTVIRSNEAPYHHPEVSKEPAEKVVYMD